MSRVRVAIDGCLGLRQCTAGLDALVPCVVKLYFPSTSAVSEPRTTATAATRFPRFRDNATFGACETDNPRCGYWYVKMDIGQNTEIETRKQGLNCLEEYLSTRFSPRLTFAGLQAIKPYVASVSIPSTSTIPIPSTAGSATARSA